jgi:hypothetical protein
VDCCGDWDFPKFFLYNFYFGVAVAVALSKPMSLEVDGDGAFDY